MKNISWKKILWFIVAVGFISGMIEALKPLKPLDLNEDTKQVFNKLTNTAEKQITEGIKKDELDSISKDLDKAVPSSEDDKVMLQLAKIIQEFKELDLEPTNKLNNIVINNNVDNAFELTTFNDTDSLNRYITAFKNLYAAQQEYINSYLENLKITMDRIDSEFSKKLAKSSKQGLNNTKEVAMKMMNSSLDYYQQSIIFLKYINELKLNNLLNIDDEQIIINDDESLNKFNELAENQELAADTFMKDTEAFTKHMNKTFSGMRERVN